MPLVTASEAARRTDIIRLAVKQATSGSEPSEVVYIGDGVWDVRACRELSIGFLGRSDSGSSQQLTNHGARAIIPDFRDLERLFKLLADPVSLVPKGGSGQHAIAAGGSIRQGVGLRHGSPGRPATP